ncbi:MAG TPA: STAS domain-containing protein [Ignavibacteriaceae bacterium]|nr:STAS domain-containing protein [Ignavibacteriaceae bacterium]
MSFSKEILNGILIVNTGLKRATIGESGELKEILINEIEKGRNKILVDLSNCEYIDSTFLGTLISASRKLLKEEGSIRILAHYTLIPSILKLTGTSKLLPIFEDKDEAIVSFSSKN